jgi:hypothetical protein
VINLTQLYIMAQLNSSDLNGAELPRPRLSQGNFTNGVRVFLGVAGAVAVIVVTYGGFKYVTSNGNPQEVSKAKNTIIDGIIGLAIIMTAFGIVSFVVERLGP